MKTEIDSWDNSYKTVDTQSPLWGDMSVPYASIAISSFSDSGAERVLDVPCGDGRNLIRFVGQFPTIVGLDSSKTALKCLQSRLSTRADNCVVLVNGTIFDLPFPDDHFDGIFCWDILGHLRDPLKAIQQLVRVCKPGGTIIGSLFSIDDETRGHSMISCGNEEYTYNEKFYYKYYKQDEVYKLLEKAEIYDSNIESVTWSEPPHVGYREYAHQHTSWVFSHKKV